MSSPPFRGLSPKLQTPRDLLAKLRRDFDHVKANPTDMDAAFNFLVTAEHLPDWINDLAIKKKHVLLRIVSHLAAGAKHMEPRDTRHLSVQDVEESEGAFQTDAFQTDAFDVGGLVVLLTPDEVRELGVSEIAILDLAERVLAFWDSQLAHP